MPVAQTTSLIPLTFVVDDRGDGRFAVLSTTAQELRRNQG
jgi:hypothetical protein